MPPPLSIYRGPPHPCPYLPDRTAIDEFTIDARMDSSAYERLMQLGFRRSGGIFYRPVCGECRECVPLRVPAAGFQPSRSQRRVRRRNADMRVEINPPSISDEKWRIYLAYLDAQHDQSMSRSREDFETFLYRSPIDTLEMTYWLGRRLIGAGFVDRCPDGLSSVYFYYDPTFARRSPGVFSALCEIDECRRLGLSYWYAGFYVRGSRKMNYKAAYRPHELLGPDGAWKLRGRSLLGQHSDEGQGHHSR
jgi:arginyl-tRNA--protein-N-Asp/Glu arginylyltransferase